MDGWMDNEKRMMAEGERELRRVSMTRLWFVWSRIPNWVHSSKSDRTCVTRRKVQKPLDLLPPPSPAQDLLSPSEIGYYSPIQLCFDSLTAS